MGARPVMLQIPTQNVCDEFFVGSEIKAPNVGRIPIKRINANPGKNKVNAIVITRKNMNFLVLIWGLATLISGVSDITKPPLQRYRFLMQ